MYNIIHFTLHNGLLYIKMRFDLWLLVIQNTEQFYAHIHNCSAGKINTIHDCGYSKLKLHSYNKSTK